MGILNEFDWEDGDKDAQIEKAIPSDRQWMEEIMYFFV